MNVEIGTEVTQFPKKEYDKWTFRCRIIFWAGRQKARRMTGKGQDVKNWDVSKRVQAEQDCGSALI
jgi:hypothetical protein